MTADAMPQPLIRAEYALERYHVVVHDQTNGAVLHNAHYATYTDADHAARNYVDITARRLITIVHEVLDGPGRVIGATVLLKVSMASIDRLAEWLGYSLEGPQTKTWSVA